MNTNQPILPPAHSQILRTLRREGPLSRGQLHERTGLRPNTVGEYVAQLIDQGLVCERIAEANGPGRPRVPLDIDAAATNVVGAAIRPGRVEACRLNLIGRPVSQLQSLPVANPDQTITTLQQLLADIINDRTALVGLSTTGFIDAADHRILQSSALRGQQAVSLDPLFETAGTTPIVIDNDMHALAARWLHEHHQQLDEDVLLVFIDDGQLGSGMLVRGKPNRGCLMGGNELGHTRLPVETERCYCGHSGCMERICSTEFLNRCGPGEGSLLERVVRYDGNDVALEHIIDLLATGLANPINFIRPHRVVLVSQFTRYEPFIGALMRNVRSRVMLELVNRVQFHYWDQAATGAGETAGWLALSAIYDPDWAEMIVLQPTA